MKRIILIVLLFLSSFLFTGCGHFWFNATPLKEDGKVKGLEIKHARVKGVNYKKYPFK